ncbi:MAG: hypothetical protein JXB60_10060, partial [Candidatus Cloacimonetes bacterium]|nr:hypothetical protein [Candidatus Cloacimonadota bacterium]
MSRLITFFLSFMFILSCTAQVSNEDLLVEVEKLYEEGKYEQAAETIDKLVTQGGESELVFYYGACTWSLVGNKEKALSYLEKAVDAGWLDKELISSDTDLDAIRSDNKYTRIMAVLDAKLAAVEASFPVEHKPLEIIVLPEPHYSGDLSVEEALQQRRSRRRYAENPLTLADVSQILWAAYGLTRPLPDAPAFLRGGLKTAPS